MDRPLLTIYYVVSLNHNANEMTLVIPRGAARWAVRQACCGASGRRPGPPCFYFTSVNGGGRSWRHAAAGSSSGLLAQLPSMEQLGLWEDDHVHVAMSGGVDSSVVLRILAEMPIQLHVVFMRNWDPLLSESEPIGPTDPTEPALSLSYGQSHGQGQGKHQCEWERDWDDVRRVATHVGIGQDRVRLVDFTKEYWNRVFEPAIGVWQAGATPNPDVDCNREIKFGSLLDSIPVSTESAGRGRHMLATGHYARVVRDPNADKLYRAIDQTKDQSYYLSQVTAAQLARSVFPLGGIRKEDVRRLARHYDLPTAERAESMGVCFIGERGKFGDFISQYTSPDERGQFITPSGERVGSHRGMWYYTIGQRARLPGMGSKWFVAKKGVGEGGLDILVVPGSDHPSLQCVEAVTDDFHWISGSAPKLDSESESEGGLLTDDGGAGYQVQLRHRMDPVPAEISLASQSTSLAKLSGSITDTLFSPLLLVNALKVSFFNPFRRAQKEHASGQIVLQVKWGRERFNIPIPNPSTTPLSQLQATLAAQTSIPITQLKLIYKGAVLRDPTLTIGSYGLTDGSTLVLVGKEGEVPTAPPAATQAPAGAAAAKKKNKQPDTDSEDVLTDWIASLVRNTVDPLAPSIATFLSYTRPPSSNPDENVNRPKEIPKFEVLQREHARLSELLLRGLLDLDSVEIPSGWTGARKERKEGVKRVQGELNRVDEAWGERKRLGA